MPTGSISVRRLVAPALAVLVGAVWLAWDWAWFIPPLESAASEAVGRPVRISTLAVQGWRQPLVSLGGIEVANPPGFPGPGSFASLRRLDVQIDPRALLDHRIQLPLIHVEQAHAELMAPAEGAPNWVFTLPPPSPEPSAWPLALGRLSITDSTLRLQHAGLKADFSARVYTRPGPRPEEPELHLDAEGRYAGQPLTASFVGGSLLGLRDQANPYPVQLAVANGPTHLKLQGSLLDPVKLGGARLQLRFEGADMAALYPLTGVPLPPTAPYRVEGGFDMARGPGGLLLTLRDFSGSVGSSDLAGTLALQLGGARPRISGQLQSKQVLLADLGGMVGAPPGAEGLKGRTPEQKAEQARAKASPRLLPDEPINLPKLRGADFDVHYVAKRVQGQNMPLDDIDAALRIEDGVLSLRPLSFGIGGGAIQSNLLLDGNEAVARVEADADFQRVDFGKVLLGATDFRGAGRIDGRLSLRSRGNSVADILGAGDGQLRLSMAGGDMSALLINLAGLDFGNALLSAMGIPNRAKLRCMVADLDMKAGLVSTDTLLLDTTEANVVGTGTVNLRNEQVDYRIQTEPKTFNIGSVAAPIDIRGPLKNPVVRPDAKALGIRGGAAVVLGIVGTPLASLLATIQLGSGKDADCAALLNAVRGEAARLPKAAALPESSPAPETPP